LFAVQQKPSYDARLGTGRGFCAAPANINMG